MIEIAPDDGVLMQIARDQLGWIVEKSETSREAGQLALLSVLMGVRDRGAVAAELLDAARALLVAADAFHDDTAHYVEVRRAEVESLRAAIAKAEGR